MQTTKVQSKGVPISLSVYTGFCTVLSMFLYAKLCPIRYVRLPVYRLSRTREWPGMACGPTLIMLKPHLTTE